MTNNIFLCSKEVTDPRRVAEAEILSTVSQYSFYILFLNNQSITNHNIITLFDVRVNIKKLHTTLFTITFGKKCVL